MSISNFKQPTHPGKLSILQAWGLPQ